MRRRKNNGRNFRKKVDQHKINEKIFSPEVRVVGDNVDGVGVYPKQEKELEIKDIKEQYRKLAEFLGGIRNSITIIMCPGGLHDAVRLIEPQPKIPTSSNCIE